jgi:alanyl-tRNA synthetase
VAAQAERLGEADRLRRRLSAELQASRARELLASATPSEDGLRRVLHRDASGDAEAVRTLAQEFSRLSRGLLVVVLEATGGVAVATTEDSGIDAAALLRAALERVGGRGGGSARVAQGRAPSAEALAEVAKTLMA